MKLLRAISESFFSPTRLLNSWTEIQKRQPAFPCHACHARIFCLALMLCLVRTPSCLTFLQCMLMLVMRILFSCLHCYYCQCYFTFSLHYAMTCFVVAMQTNVVLHALSSFLLCLQCMLMLAMRILFSFIHFHYSHVYLHS